MTIAAAKINPHPDAVFGPDGDALLELVERLKVTDTSALSSAASSKLATGLAAAARRIVADYTSLERDRASVAEERAKLTALRLELETREASVLARETLLGLYPAPEPAPKRGWHFWK